MRAILFLLLSALSLWAQTQRVEVVLEKREKGAWKAMDPGYVFGTGDQVRFRFRSNFSGYLYVVNQGSSGESITLFPSQEAGKDNRVEAGKEYLIPSTEQGAFRLTGPAGFDSVYWIVAPVKIAMEGSSAKPADASAEPPAYQPLPPPPTPLPSNLSPRCDDAILRSRGDCIDARAGMQSAQPPSGQSPPGLVARELFFRREPQKSIASAPPKNTAPLTYLFRLAHK